MHCSGVLTLSRVLSCIPLHTRTVFLSVARLAVPLPFALFYQILGICYNQKIAAGAKHSDRDQLKMHMHPYTLE